MGLGCKCFAALRKEIAQQQRWQHKDFSPHWLVLRHAVPHCNFSKLIDSLLEIFSAFPSICFPFDDKVLLPIVIVNFVHENNAKQTRKELPVEVNEQWR